jgi:hypothetical protein
VIDPALHQASAHGQPGLSAADDQRFDRLQLSPLLDSTGNTDITDILYQLYGFLLESAAEAIKHEPHERHEPHEQVL